MAPTLRKISAPSVGENWRKDSGMQRESAQVIVARPEGPAPTARRMAKVGMGVCVLIA